MIQSIVMDINNICSSGVAGTLTYNPATTDSVVKNDIIGARQVSITDKKNNIPGPHTPEVALMMRKTNVSLSRKYHGGYNYKNMDIDHPKTFNEKILFLRLNENPDLKARLENKLWVRDYIKEKIGEKYLVKLYAVYNKLEDLDFDKLPNQFVLKRTVGSLSKQVLIVPDKSKLDIIKTREIISKWLKNDRQVIAEEYLTNENNDLYDYKIFCANGKISTIGFYCNRRDILTQAFFDTDWNYQGFSSGKNLHPNPETIIKPKNLNEMLDVAKTLSKDFSHVRVDLYHLNDGTVKFGELTFKTAAGLAKWSPTEINLKLGNMITLPGK